jgi:hypothetical protein
MTLAPRKRRQGTHIRIYPKIHATRGNGLPTGVFQSIASVKLLVIATSYDIHEMTSKWCTSFIRY